MARSRPKTRRHPRSNPRGILKLTGGGYGFVQTAEGEFFVPAAKLYGAFDGDLVELARISDNKGHQYSKAYGRSEERPCAKVVRVLDRAHETVLGRYEIAEPFGIVVPEDRRIPYDIFTMRAENPSLRDGDIVLVRITDYPGAQTAALGVVEERIGHESDANFGVEMIIARHRLETQFSEAACEQACNTGIDTGKALSEGYHDLRERRVFTIDPLDARDFDDALSIEALGEGRLRLGVHIADVSRYVPWNSALDLDAQKRATSVYLVDRVLPMLPEELSSGVCSLKPGQDRLVMTVDLFLDKGASLERYEIYPALIRSSERFNYEQIQGILDRKKADRSGAVQHPFSEDLDLLHQIAQAQLKKRVAAGGIDFVSSEAKVRLDEAGKAVEILIRKRTDATSLVEEAMILANVTVAKHLESRGFPCLYRVHGKPDADDLAQLVPILQEFDYLREVPMADFITGKPFCVQEVLRACKGRHEEELISSLILRAMSRAIYQPLCEPHYALAKAEYCHFTSPIRRYPDLVVHRMLKAELFGKSGTFEQELNCLERLGAASSAAERVAEMAERESQELKIIEYLQNDIGALFEAVVSGVTNFGLFVRLANTAEGLIPIRSLGGEYFSYDPKRHVLCGEESGRSFRLGQKLKVVLEAADPRLARLDFRLA
ncbi:MAG: ribonuclease R [Eggerthellaceae bacterium]|nr:ribonuclease R [Eggerthellaceae bacterium]